MKLVHPLTIPAGLKIPTAFDSPFCNQPSALAELAARQMQAALAEIDFRGHDFFAAGAGQMFGVLAVELDAGQVGYLQAFSGRIGAAWRWPGFAPPAFDDQRRAALEATHRRALLQLTERRRLLECDPDYNRAQQQLCDGQRRLEEQTRQLQAQLQLRRSERRHARGGADLPTLERLRREGEADARLRARDKREARRQLDEWRDAVHVYSGQIAQLSAAQSELEQHFLAEVLNGYRLCDGRGERVDLAAVFEDRLWIDGAGDCAGVKLLNAAYQRRLRPLALAEFWWGAPPADEVRHHRHFYPSCRGRCRPLLASLLQGLPAGRQPSHLEAFADTQAPAVIYEDKHLLLVDKPAGLLSVPGLAMVDSVQSRLHQRYPDLPELQLVHRLDQSTSGLLLAAKTRRDHKALQRQFSDRSIQKEYIALLDGEPPAEQGEVDLPLRVDLADRPRQLVCESHGKPALTRWRVLARERGRTRVALHPVTGRTHQLRVHMAHAHGLATPIVGDELYGKPGERLFLHAQSLAFIHPGSGERVSFVAPAPF